MPLHKRMDLNAEAVVGVLQALSSERRLAEAFCRTRWPALEGLMAAGVPLLLVELVAAAAGGERWGTPVGAAQGGGKGAVERGASALL